MIETCDSLFDFLRTAIIDEDNGGWLAKPVWQDGVFYFCDGRILVTHNSESVPGDETDCWVIGNKFRIPNIKREMPFVAALDTARECAEHELPIVTKPRGCDDCWLCKGDCRECDGTGQVECDMGHDHECPDCAGLGIVDEIVEESLERIELSNGVGFARRYLWVLSKLEGIKIGNPVDNSPLFFTHASGEGCLMPLKSKG